MEVERKAQCVARGEEVGKAVDVGCYVVGWLGVEGG